MLSMLIIIAGITFFLWHLYNKNQDTKKDERKKIKDLEAHILKIKHRKNEMELNEKIILVQEELKFFYWPISLHIKNDYVSKIVPSLYDDPWKIVTSLYDDGKQLPTEANWRAPPSLKTCHPL